MESVCKRHHSSWDFLSCLLWLSTPCFLFFTLQAPHGAGWSPWTPSLWKVWRKMGRHIRLASGQVREGANPPSQLFRLFSWSHLGFSSGQFFSSLTGFLMFSASVDLIINNSSIEYDYIHPWALLCSCYAFMLQYPWLTFVPITKSCEVSDDLWLQPPPSCSFLGSLLATQQHSTFQQKEDSNPRFFKTYLKIGIYLEIE